MREKIALIVLFVTTLLFGVINGGGIYEEIVVGPVWSSSPPTSFALIQEPNGLSLASFWVPFHIIANIFLVLSLVMYWKERRRRNLLLVALGLYTLIRIVTLLYFVPEITEFMNTSPNGPFSAELAARANQWNTLSWIRTFVGEIIVNVLLLLAISQPDKERK